MALVVDNSAQLTAVLVYPAEIAALLAMAYGYHFAFCVVFEYFNWNAFLAWCYSALYSSFFLF